MGERYYIVDKELPERTQGHMGFNFVKVYGRNIECVAGDTNVVGVLEIRKGELEVKVSVGDAYKIISFSKSEFNGFFLTCRKIESKNEVSPN